MSVAIHVFFDGAIPSFGAWQGSIAEAGYELVVEPLGELAQHSGFLPASLNGRATGFELSFDHTTTPAEVVVEVLNRPEAERSWQCCASFYVGSDPDQLMAATIGAAALACLMGGVLIDPQAGTIHSRAKALDFAFQIVAELGRG